MPFCRFAGENEEKITGCKTNNLSKIKQGMKFLLATLAGLLTASTNAYFLSDDVVDATVCSVSHQSSNGIGVGRQPWKFLMSVVAFQ
jgi:hypothetical protein